MSAGKGNTLVRHHLRKGKSNVYLHYESGSGDTICAEKFEAAVEGTAVVIRFHLKPVDDNQSIDERRLHSETLTEVHISDDYIVDNLARFLRQPYVTAQEMRLQILSQDKPLDYMVSFGAAEVGHLPLLVQRIAS
jgi:hypothetical protein